MLDSAMINLGKMGSNSSKSSQPSQFTLGVAEQLRDIAAKIEKGTLTVTHVSLTTSTTSTKQRLLLDVD